MELGSSLKMKYMESSNFKTKIKFPEALFKNKVYKPY